MTSIENLESNHPYSLLLPLLLRALQCSGLGRNAMHQLEQAASSPPFNCTTMALDTVRADFQKSELWLGGFYDDRGLPRPDVTRTNEEWYMRQGYEILGAEAGAYEWMNRTTGKIMEVPRAFFKKDLRKIRPRGGLGVRP
ncbi:hypothetical protein E4U24_000108 [Claviceps purpurea]|nr:hypothetical protein E4U24_000108 [Claviceps purpurea]